MALVLKTGKRSDSLRGFESHALRLPAQTIVATPPPGMLAATSTTPTRPPAVPSGSKPTATRSSATRPARPATPASCASRPAHPTRRTGRSSAPRPAGVSGSPASAAWTSPRQALDTSGTGWRPSSLPSWPGSRAWWMAPAPGRRMMYETKEQVHDRGPYILDIRPRPVPTPALPELRRSRCARGMGKAVDIGRSGLGTRTAPLSEPTLPRPPAARGHFRDPGRGTTLT
jgi:hypothetical protein